MRFTYFSLNVNGELKQNPDALSVSHKACLVKVLALIKVFDSRLSDTFEMSISKLILYSQVEKDNILFFCSWNVTEISIICLSVSFKSLNSIRIRKYLIESVCFKIRIRGQTSRDLS